LIDSHPSLGRISFTPTKEVIFFVKDY
jgi:hypothetical protein